MSPRGQVGNGKKRWVCTEAERKLTDALLEVYEVFKPRTQAEVAALLYCSPSAMSQYLNLQRAIPLDFVEALYTAALALEAVGGIAAMPIQREELLALHDEAGREGWSRRNGSAAAGAPRDGAFTAALPVPSGNGDRQFDVQPVPHWEGVEDIRRLLADGRGNEAARLLDHAGASMSASDVRVAAANCRDLCFDGSAEAVLRSAGRRGTEHILNVTRELVRAGQHADVVILLLGDGSDAESDNMNSTAVQRTAHAPETELDVMMVNEDLEAPSSSRLGSVTAIGTGGCAGPISEGDRRSAIFPRQRVSDQECGAGVIGLDPATGGYVCACSNFDQETFSICGESDDDGDDLDTEEGGVQPCPDQADHIYCEACDRYWRPRGVRIPD